VVACHQKNSGIMLTNQFLPCTVQVVKEVHHYTKEHWLKCDRCETPMPPEFWHRKRTDKGFVYEDECETTFPLSMGQVDNGLTLILEGGYGMFTDPMTEERMRDFVWTLCHDCVVAMLEFFPERLRKRFEGGHPAYDDNTPLEERCCRYAWCSSDVTGDDTGN